MLNKRIHTNYAYTHGQTWIYLFIWLVELFLNNFLFHAFLVLEDKKYLGFKFLITVSYVIDNNELFIYHREY